MKAEDKIQKAAQAKETRKVTLIKGFYRHLVLFLIFIIFLLIDAVIVNRGGGSLFGPIDFIPTIFYWGPWAMSIIVHGIIAFDVVVLLRGKNWEDKKVEKLMEKDQEPETTLWE